MNEIEPCKTVDESLQTLIDCIKILSDKHDKKAFYPTTFYYETLRYLKLVKRCARFYMNEEKMMWAVDKPNNWSILIHENNHSI